MITLCAPDIGVIGKNPKKKVDAYNDIAGEQVAA